MIVTFHDALTVPYFSRHHGFCRAGMRDWFARYGLDYEDFKRNGVPEERLLAIGDAFADATVKWAHARAAAEPRNG